MLNADTNSIKQICKLLPGADSPTIIPLQQKNKVAIHALCSEPVFWETMEKLKQNGVNSTEPLILIISAFIEFLRK